MSALVPWGRMAMCLGLMLGLGWSGGCVSKRNLSARLGTPDQDADDAVGFVSISTPLFTPMDGTLADDDRLDFGEMKKESKIAEELMKPAFGSLELTADIFRMALAARVAGVAVNMTETTTTKVPAAQLPAADSTGGTGTTATPPGPTTEVDRVTERKFETPEPIDPKALVLPGFDFTKEKNSQGASLAQILLDVITPASGEGKFRLPQDELATLIAGLKSYMVNLEQYYNVEGYDYARGLTGRYVPYRVHFTVTAEPGWYSRYQQYDAVCELRLRMLMPGGKEPEDGLVVLSASPAEVGQTITEFHAALTHFAASLQASAPIGDFAQLGANMDALISAAKRLQGIRTHKTMAVGFPDSNSIRVRMLAQRAAVERGQDLQPVSRLISAVVLVPVPEVDPGDEDRSDPGMSPDARSFAAAGEQLERAEFELECRDLLAEAHRDLVGRLAAAIGRYEEARRTLPAAERERGEVAAFRRTVEVLDVAGRRAAIDEASAKKFATLVEGAVQPLLLSAPLWDGTDIEPAERVTCCKELGCALAEGKPCEFHRNLLGPKRITLFQSALDAEGAARQAERLSEARVELFDETARAFQANQLTRQLLSGIPEGIVVRPDGEGPESCSVRRLQAQVRRYLRGQTCGVQVAAYYTPTVFDSTGGWNPPRDFLFGVEPPADRLLAGHNGCGRVAPIPPWMGPLDERVKISSVSAYYTVDLARLAAPQFELHGLEQELAKQEAALAKLIDHQKNPAWRALEESRAAEERLVEQYELLKARAQTAVRVLALKIEQDQKLLAAENGKGQPDPELVKTLNQRITANQGEIRTLEADLAATEMKRDMAVEYAKEIAKLASVKRAEQDVASTKTRIAELKTQVKGLQLRLSGPAVLGRGEAVVGFSCWSPNLLLDERMKLIHHTKTYARVLGLRRVCTDSLNCELAAEALDSQACGAGPACCAPGEFCLLPPGQQDFVIHVQDVDLSTAIAGDNSATISGANIATNASGGKTLRAFLQVLLVPDACKRPDEGLTDPAARVRIIPIDIIPRAQPLPVLATPPAAPPATPPGGQPPK